MPRRIGIIGCGGIARSHVQAYIKENAVIVGITDADPEAAKKLSDEIGGVGIFTDFQDLIDTTQPDAVSICTPPVAHEEAAVYALSRRVHVLCEKPMAFNIPSAHRMRDAADKSRALFMPAFRHRFLPANIYLRDLIASGEIGEPVFFNNIFCGPAFDMEFRWFTKQQIAGGGCVIDTNSHSVDLFRFIIGEIADQSLLSHRRFKTTDVEDTGVLTVKAENGALGSLQSSFTAGAGIAFIDIVGTRGRAVFDYMDGGKVRVKTLDDTDWRTHDAAPSDGFVEEVSHFLGAINGDHPLAVTIEDGVRSMEVICNAYANCCP